MTRDTAFRPLHAARETPMLSKLVPFEDKVTLIMNTGVQFLDFGLTLELRKAISLCCGWSTTSATTSTTIPRGPGSRSSPS